MSHLFFGKDDEIRRCNEKFIEIQLNHDFSKAIANSQRFLSVENKTLDERTVQSGAFVHEVTAVGSLYLVWLVADVLGAFEEISTSLCWGTGTG